MSITLLASVVTMCLSVFTYLVPIIKPEHFQTPESHIVIFLLALFFNLFFLLTYNSLIYAVRNDVEFLKHKLDLYKERDELYNLKISFLEDELSHYKGLISAQPINQINQQKKDV